MKKQELLKRLARAELRVDIHYQMLKETNLEVDKLKDMMSRTIEYFHATGHPYTKEIKKQITND